MYTKQEVINELHINEPLLAYFIERKKLAYKRGKEGEHIFEKESVEQLKDTLEAYGLTTKEASVLAQVTEQTIKKRLTPWNKETWRIDGTYVYHFHDVIDLTQTFTKPGMTPRDVADYLKDKHNIKVSSTTVFLRIKSGDLPSELKTYRGLKTHFVQKEDIDAHLALFEKQTNQHAHIHEETGYYLYQPFTNQEGELARVVEVDSVSGVLLQTEREDVLDEQELEELGFKPVYTASTNERIMKKGEIGFEFTQPKHVKSVIYDCIDMIYKAVGPKNVRAEEATSTLRFFVKPCVLPVQQKEYRDEIEVLRQSLINGEVNVRPHEITLESDMVPFVGWGSKALKEKAKQKAAQEGLDLERFIIDCVEARVDD
ncbi:hypothetical protein [Caldalkalibacillus salinus]|uniref:hypothetical protein n=1 Tax=Caldalkalibacillus salinus TaxID=2803787 RepID=UPI001920B60C|nr:hypothetical protein [Caldalkalibacillus salinus]